MSNDPVRAWSELAMSQQGDGVKDVVSRSAKVETGYGVVRFALGPLGEPRLLIPCAAGTSGRSLDDGPKLSVSVAPYHVDLSQQLFIDVLCLDRRLNAVFGELCKEILKRLSEGEGPAESVAGTISDFRELLLARAAENVSRSVIAGLLGELHILQMLAKDLPGAIDAWKGPFEQRHDFRRSGFAIEVKTSLRSDATRVSIHGADQLLEPAHGNLILAHIRMEPVDQGVVNVGALYELLVASGVDPMQLRSCLAELGCADPKDADWNRHAFEVQGIDAYSVVSGFPRVTPHDFPGGRIPPAIARLSYDVDLSAAGQYRLEEGGLSEFIGVMVR